MTDNRMKWKLSILCFILAFGYLAEAQADERKADPTGTWKWNTPNPDGRIPNIAITLNLRGGALTGTVTRSSGAMAITNGVFKGDQVIFQTVSKRKDGRTTTCTYRGKLKGDTIKGKMQIDVSGRMLSSDWEAKRGAATPNNAGTE